MTRRFLALLPCLVALAVLVTACDTSPTATEPANEPTGEATPASKADATVLSKLEGETQPLEILEGIQIRQVQGEKPAVILETSETEIALTPQEAQLLGTTLNSAGYSLRPLDIRQEVPRADDDPYCRPAPDYGYVTLPSGGAFYLCPNPPPMPPFYEIFLDAQPVAELPDNLTAVPGGAIGEPR